MKKLTKAEQEKAAKIWAKIIARAWEDEKFKKRLLSKPAEVLKEYGLIVPEEVALKIIEDTDAAKHLTLPQKPLKQLTEEEMRGLAAAGSFKLAFWEP